MTTVHTIEPSPQRVHCSFDPAREPILVIDDGDTLRCSTPDIAGGVEQHDRDKNTRAKIRPPDPNEPPGPVMLGPVAIRGAEPGSVLEIRFDRIQPETWGWSWSGSGFFNESLNRALGLDDEQSALLLWTLDPEAREGVSELGHRVGLRPFFGTIGLSPATPGHSEGFFPRATGGNMDCRELVEGSTLYLPIAVEGGLLSLGDGHALQGDGEVGGTAIECPMARVELTLRVRREMSLRGPLAQTPAGRVALGFGETLEQASRMALDGLLDWMVRELEPDRRRALMLASALADLRITQIVNGVVGVHAVLPDAALDAWPTP